MVLNVLKSNKRLILFIVDLLSYTISVLLMLDKYPLQTE